MSKNDFQLIVSPIRHLRELAFNLNERVALPAKYRDNFSWVIGLSEVEITDFVTKYNTTKEEIENFISVTDNKKLKEKLQKEYKLLQQLNAKEFIVDLDKTFWLFIIKPFKAIRKTIKFKNILRETSLICK